MKKNLLIAFVLLFTAFTRLQAKLWLPAVFSNYMVLQQQTAARIWGTASPGAKVKIVPSWNNRPVQVTADTRGRWNACVSTPAASFTPCTVTISADGERRVLRQVLIGEVWFCSGQSNMEMPLHGFSAQPVEGANQAIAYAADYRHSIRLLTVPKTRADVPQDSVGGSWQECVPDNAQWFSAVGFFFARSLTRMLQVPVGVINCSWGGSKVEGWLPDSILTRRRDIGAVQPGETGQYEYDTPCIMYNGMLRPLAGYTVKGFLWNQGESNVGRHAAYPTLFRDMAEHWRTLWADRSLPFYCVEIPPYSYGNPDGINAALLREAQHKAVRQTPFCGMVCTNDLMYPWQVEDIHGSRKREIGERLAFMAAVRSYGMQGVACDSPEFTGMTVSGRQAVLAFSHAENGLLPHEQLDGFEVAGTDRVFRPATVREDMWPPRVVLTAPAAVDTIMAVRYRFRNFSIGNVYNGRGLPLVPFRTDHWDDVQ